MELLGLMPNASNHTFLARCVAGDEELLAIYKPRDGETPLWDFPEGTLHRREVAAWELAAAIGWPNVPPTVRRDGPLGVGSAQRFVRFDPSAHYFTLEAGRQEEFLRIALFDVVVNNADRKSGHCLLGEDGSVWAIDHGVCFHEEPKLRTVIWAFIDEPIPTQERADLERLGDQLDGPLGERLVALLSPEEAGALAARLERLLTAGTLPGPDPALRPFPWPPI
jgi:hypothetical protein